MATIAENLSRIQSSKTDIKTAIEAKGVTVPSSATIDTYATYISQISGGGGGIPMPSNLSAATLNNFGLLTSAAIKNGVTSISNGAFRYCKSLSSIEIPDSVTSIANSAFESCSSLTSITIPDSVTSISDYAFNGCISLTSIEIPDSVTSIGGSVFANCSGITSCTIGSGVTSIGNFVFRYCTKLTSIEIPDSVTSIGNFVFANCSGITSCTIGSGVTSIANSAFESCSSLTSVTIPNSVTSIGNSVFRYCKSLSSIDIPDSVTSIGNSVFQNCISLTSVTVNAVTPPTISGNVFSNTNNCPIYVPSGSVDVYKSATNWSTYASRIQAIPEPTLQWVTFNNGDTIPSDLDIYGFSGVSQNLNDTFGYGKHFKFTPSRNYIDWCITDNTTASCHCGHTLNTEVISVIFSEVSCDDYYNRGATVRGTIQLYIYA